MKGLIVKDLLNLKGQVKSCIPALILYIIFFSWNGDIDSFVLIIFFITSMLGISAFYSDETTNFNKYLLTMNISRRKIVISRYIASTIILSVGVIIISIFHMVLNQNIVNQDVISFVQYLIITFLCISLFYPMLFLIGYDRGKFMIMGALFIAYVLFELLPQLGINLSMQKYLDEIIQMKQVEFIAIALFIVLILFFISIMMSIRIVKKKEFS